MANRIVTWDTVDNIYPSDSAPAAAGWLITVLDGNNAVTQSIPVVEQGAVTVALGAGSYTIEVARVDTSGNVIAKASNTVTVEPEITFVTIAVPRSVTISTEIAVPSAVNVV